MRSSRKHTISRASNAHAELLQPIAVSLGEHFAIREGSKTSALASLRKLPLSPNTWNAVDYVGDKVEAVEVIQHHHVEKGWLWCLLPCSIVQVVVIGPPVSKPI